LEPKLIGAKEVVTTVATTTSPQTNGHYNMTKYQIHSEKIILTNRIFN